MGKGGVAEGHGEGHSEGKGCCKGTTEYEAIPTMSCSIALFCCLLNCCIPGCGTILAGLCCSKDEEIDGKPIWKINCFAGFAQFFTSLCFFGLLWNWMWGCYMIGKSPSCRDNPVVTQQPISTGLVAIIIQSTGVPSVGGVAMVKQNPAASTGPPAGPLAFNTPPRVPMAATGPEVYPPVYPPQYPPHHPLHPPVTQQPQQPPCIGEGGNQRGIYPPYTPDDPVYPPGQAF